MPRICDGVFSKIATAFNHYLILKNSHIIDLWHGPIYTSAIAPLMLNTRKYTNKWEHWLEKRLCEHPFSACAKFSKNPQNFLPPWCALTYTCTYLGVRNISFFENFAKVKSLIQVSLWLLIFTKMNCLIFFQKYICRNLYQNLRQKKSINLKDTMISPEISV